jgi:hypothetical protein
VWVGGGVALGPKPRSYVQKTPKKMKALALRSALSDRAAIGNVALVDQWSFEAPSTKAAVAALRALELEGKILVVLTEDDFVADRSFGNLPEVQTLLVNELNAYDILVNDWIVFTDDTLPGSPKVVSAVEVDVVEDEDGNVTEIIETEVDVVTDGKGHVTEIIETEIDEVIGDDGEVEAIVETQVDMTLDDDGEVTSVTETVVVEVADEESADEESADEESEGNKS